jgi:hypothetical protein
MASHQRPVRPSQNVARASMPHVDFRVAFEEWKLTETGRERGMEVTRQFIGNEDAIRANPLAMLCRALLCLESSAAHSAFKSASDYVKVVDPAMSSTAFAVMLQVAVWSLDRAMSGKLLREIHAYATPIKLEMIASLDVDVLSDPAAELPDKSSVMLWRHVKGATLLDRQRSMKNHLVDLCMVYTNRTNRTSPWSNGGEGLAPPQHMTDVSARRRPLPSTDLSLSQIRAPPDPAQATKPQGGTGKRMAEGIPERLERVRIFLTFG